MISVSLDTTDRHPVLRQERRGKEETKVCFSVEVPGGRLSPVPSSSVVASVEM